jgi:hypothetical protein
MSSPFQRLRSLALSLSTRADTESQIVEAICLMSEINEVYLEISIERDRVRAQLQEKAEEARTAQFVCEEWVHACQLKADSNMAVQTTTFNEKGLKLIPIEEYSDAQRREIERMSETELLQYRLEHDTAELPALTQQLQEIRARKVELQDRLTAARQRYSAILPKMQRMYEEVLGFAKK